MAGYVPAAVVGVTALTATPGTSLLTGTNLQVYVMRTIHLSSSAASKAATFSIGADAAGKRLFDAFVITQNVPAIFNGWWVFTGSGAAHDLDGSVSATTAQIYIGGYTFS